jgi:hypothetical protein
MLVFVVYFQENRNFLKKTCFHLIHVPLYTGFTILSSVSFSTFRQWKLMTNVTIYFSRKSSTKAFVYEP